jgi:hypothetical protein
VKKPKRELLSREGLVSGWTLDIYASAVGTKNIRSRESARYLIVEGEFTEAVKGVAKFLLQVSPESEPGVGAREMPCVGSVLQLKPQIQAAATLTSDEFHDLLLLASTGKLRTFQMAFQEPHYGHALIASMSFSSRDPERE